jgi:outer membrane protein OmpA-like peptidoglycan-associated protein
LRNGAALKVVQLHSESMDDIRQELEEKVRASRPRPMSLRPGSPLSVAGMMAAASAAVESFGGRGEGSAAGAKASRGSGRAGSGGGGGRKPPNIDRSFNQDDLVAVLIVLALLLMLGLYFIRGAGTGAEPERLVNTQFAASAPAPAPPVPLKDPFGDQPLDLTPKAAPPPAADVAPAPAPVPAPAPACAAGHTMRAFFCTDRANLTDASKLALEKELTDWNACFKDRELVVTGYADTRGPNVYNTYLGGERAKVVADFLKSRGIKVAQLTGVGELEGLADNKNCANQRRVDISFAGENGEPNRSCAPPEDVAALVCN